MSIFALAFVLVYGTVLVKSFTSRPFFGLCAYLMAFYLNPPMRWWGEFLPDLRWSFTAAAVTLISIFMRDGGVLMKGWLKETKIFAVFLLFVFLQIFWAIDTKTHMEWVSTTFNFFVLMVMLQGAIRDQRDIVGFVIMNLIGCSYFGYLGAIRVAGGRLDGIGGPAIASSNQMSQHLIAILFSGAYLLFLRAKPLWWRAMILVLLLVVVKTILMAGSRGSFLAIGITAVVALLFTPKLIRKRVYLLAVAAGVAGVIAIGPLIMERFEGVFGPQVEEIADESARSRVFIIDAQIEMFKTAPWLGHGHKGTQLLSPFYLDEQFRTRTTDGQEGVRASHNFLLSLLVDHGLIGASIYIWIILRCLLILPSVVRTTPKTDEAFNLQMVLIGLILGLLCHMISGMTSDHKNGETDIWFYVLIPLCWLRLKEINHAR